MTPEELFKKHMRLAYSVGWRFQRQFPALGLETEDVLQEALLGLWKACRLFKADKGFEFSTLAVRVMSNDLLRLVKHASARKRQGTVISLQLPVSGTRDGRGMLVADTVAAPPIPADLDALDLEDAPALKMWLEGYTQEEIADSLGCSQPTAYRAIKADEARKKREIGEVLGVADAFRFESRRYARPPVGWDLRTEEKGERFGA